MKDLRSILDKFETLVDSEVGVRRWLSDRYSIELSPGVVAMQGEALLFGAIKCFLADKPIEGAQVLARGEEFLRLAIERTTGDDLRYKHADSAFHLDLCCWLAGPSSPRPDLSRAIQIRRDWLAARRGSVLLGDMDDLLPVLMDAGDGETCIREYERGRGRFQSVTGRHGEARMAYLLAVWQRDGVMPEELAGQIDKFLHHYVPEMLGHGFYSTYARWIKLLERPESGPPAQRALREVVLRSVAA